MNSSMQCMKESAARTDITMWPITINALCKSYICIHNKCDQAYKNQQCEHITLSCISANMLCSKCSIPFLYIAEECSLNSAVVRKFL